MSQQSVLLSTTNILGDPKAEPPIKAIIPVSHEKLRTMINDGEFPQPIKIGNRNFWRSSDVATWIEKKALEAAERQKR